MKAGILYGSRRGLYGGRREPYPLLVGRVGYGRRCGVGRTGT
ncbi:hypothetical protein OIE66_29790 [Nonomuraea sp. NBC_01738]|nr:hypothetical protein OIE66_29790 [Nonomuraea sp. NBC_01738]